MGLRNLLENLGGGNTLFYPGCLTKYKAPEWSENYQKILNVLNIDFIMIDKLNCCGSPVLNAGDKKTYEDNAQKVLEILKEYGVSKIITGCPACYKNFASEYPEFLKDDWDIEAYHISQILAEQLDEKKLELKKLDYSITYHDPCHLGRQMDEYEAPRKLLKAMSKEFTEMELNMSFSFCCGGGGGVATNFQKRALKTAVERVEQALETESDILVSTCPMCVLHMQNALKSGKVGIGAKESESDTESNLRKGLKIKEISELLAEAMDL